MEMTIVWTLFVLFVVVMLSLDLFVFHKQDEVVKLKSALIWSAVWVSLALLAAVGVGFWKGADTAVIFTTGYLLEFSLSVDNLFVFLVIFSFFSVPEQYMHRVLFWGILGAVVFRALFILGGVAIVSMFSWIMYIFAAFLIYTGFKLFFSGDDDETSLGEKPLVKLLSKWSRFSKEFHGHDFFFRGNNGLLMMTPLALVLIVIELSDVFFAVDSVPAILGILPKSWDEELKMFIAFSSNIFAILGLRSFFFALAGFMKMLRFLRYGLAVVLAFIGVKLALGEADLWEPGIALSLLILLGILGVSVLLSIVVPEKKEEEKPDVSKEALPENKAENDNVGNGRSAPWIGVDLDGTLAEYRGTDNLENIGNPVPVMLERVKFWLKKGYTVKIFTARASLGEKGIVPVKKWLEKNGLPELEITCQKDFSMIEFWDDRAIQVVQNTGKPFLSPSILGRPAAPILPDEKAGDTFYLLKNKTGE